MKRTLRMKILQGISIPSNDLTPTAHVSAQVLPDHHKLPSWESQDLSNHHVLQDLLDLLLYDQSITQTSCTL